LSLLKENKFSFMKKFFFPSSPSFMNDMPKSTIAPGCNEHDCAGYGIYMDGSAAGAGWIVLLEFLQCFVSFPIFLPFNYINYPVVISNKKT
jgi:hypothetical protein